MRKFAEIEIDCFYNMPNTKSEEPCWGGRRIRRRRRKNQQQFACLCCILWKSFNGKSINKTMQKHAMGNEMDEPTNQPTNERTNECKIHRNAYKVLQLRKVKSNNVHRFALNLSGPTMEAAASAAATATPPPTAPTTTKIWRKCKAFYNFVHVVRVVESFNQFSICSLFALVGALLNNSHTLHLTLLVSFGAPRVKWEEEEKKKAKRTNEERTSAKHIFATEFSMRNFCSL